MKYLKLFEEITDKRITDLSNEEIMEEIKLISLDINDIDTCQVEVKMMNPKAYTRVMDGTTSEIKTGPIIDIKIININSSRKTSDDLNWTYQLRNPNGSNYKEYNNFWNKLVGFCEDNGLDVCQPSTTWSVGMYINITIVPKGKHVSTSELLN